MPTELVGTLRDSSDLLVAPAAMRARLAEDGYLFLRGALDARAVAMAREEVAKRLVAVGELREPAAEAIATGESRRAELEPDLGAFWKSVSEGPMLRLVTHGPRLKSVMQAVAGAPVRGQDYLFLRAGAVGRATGLHYDYPFFARAHEQVFTVWIPIGDVPVSDGPLMVVEGSNRFDDLIQPMKGFDVATDTTRRAQLTDDPVEMVRSRGTRLLTADFRAGDMLVFGMFTLHGSLDNHSPINRVRLSCDIRYQPAAAPMDGRYFGDSPTGTTGIGYGELNGAKPLTQPWHIR